MSVASLPMYDLPELEAAHDRLWQGWLTHFKREGLSDVPTSLARGLDLAQHWRDPQLWFSQCCGYPLVKTFGDVLQPVATPVYDVPGCDGATYSSVVIVRDNDPASLLEHMRGRVCAINGWDSHSGMNALRGLIAPLACEAPFFSQVKVSGAHVASVHMVVSGDADIAAIDCVTFALLERYRPAAVAGVRIIARTEQAPSLPYVTAKRVDAERLERMRAALANALDDCALDDVNAALFLDQVAVTETIDYRAISDCEKVAEHLGYPVLE